VIGGSALRETRSTVIEALYKQYVNSGYHLVGFSTFTHVYVPMDLNAPNQNDMLDQARKVHADIVIYFTVPDGYVENDAITLRSHDQSTSAQEPSVSDQDNDARPAIVRRLIS
jgi:hypothetical protein